MIRDPRELVFCFCFLLADWLDDWPVRCEARRGGTWPTSTSFALCSSSPTRRAPASRWVVQHPAHATPSTCPRARSRSGRFPQGEPASLHCALDKLNIHHVFTFASRVVCVFSFVRGTIHASPVRPTSCVSAPVVGGEAPTEPLLATLQLIAVICARWPCRRCVVERRFQAPT